MPAHETDAELERLRTAVAAGDYDAVERCLALLERRAGDFERAGDDVAVIEPRGRVLRGASAPGTGGEGLADVEVRADAGPARRPRRAQTGPEARACRPPGVDQRVRADPTGSVELLKSHARAERGAPHRPG
ncbi:MAG: hypothetical protein IPF99_29950 [Deltaproteobacteria bacterium]|nr:hypothetical protein [Deltaproteobacteria bacterium]